MFVCCVVGLTGSSLLINFKNLYMNDVNSNVITVTFTTTAITQHRGALAHIMACYMADKYPGIKVTMIGFGNPRIGNKTFKDWSERKTNLAV